MLKPGHCRKQSELRPLVAPLTSWQGGPSVRRIPVPCCCQWLHPATGGARYSVCQWMRRLVALAASFLRATRPHRLGCPQSHPHLLQVARALERTLEWWWVDSCRFVCACCWRPPQPLTGQPAIHAWSHLRRHPTWPPSHCRRRRRRHRIGNAGHQPTVTTWKTRIESSL